MSVNVNVRRAAKRYKKKGLKLDPRMEAALNRKVNSSINRNHETKYRDYTFSNVSITSTGSSVGLPFDVPQGNGVNDRNGNQYKLFGLNINYEVEIADTTNTVRFIIYQWKSLSTSAPLPSLSSVLNVGPSSAIDVYSSYNEDSQKDITILYDRIHTLIGNGTTNYPYTAKSLQHVRKNISLKRCRKIVNVDINGQGTNRLFLIYLSDSSASLHPTFTMNTRLMFKDI